MPEVLNNPSVLRVRAALEAAGIAPAIIELPGAARTAQAAAAFLDCDVGQIANSLVFRAERSGGVAPVGHATRVASYVEKSLAAYREIWAAAGHPHTVFRLSYEELLRITGGLAVEVAA